MSSVEQSVGASRVTHDGRYVLSTVWTSPEMTSAVYSLIQDFF